MAQSESGELSSNSITLGVGETGQITWSMSTPSSIVSNDTTIATLTHTGTSPTGTITITGVSAGVTTATVQWGMGQSTITITVTAPAEDESYLNKRGLTHFWENIDSLKQDTLTAGTNISINNGTISSSQPAATTSSLGVVQVGSGLAVSSGGVLSATGGGVADSVAWGHITGTLADQSDLNTALGSKANTADLATVATSGSYNDLTNKPTIPTVNNATLTVQKNGTTIDTFTANASQNKTINITVPVTASDVSALPASTKYAASLTASINTTTYVMTLTLKDQDGNTLGTAQTIDLPLESVVVNGTYDSTNKKIILTLQGGGTIDIPVGDLVAGLQSEITSTNKLDSDLVDDTGQTNKFMTSAEKTKLSGIAAGAEVNVQSDWNQTTTTADDYIKNKPQLATVATSGAYSDLSGTPSLATVATSGSYNDLSNKPTIPAAQVNSDWNSTSGVSEILNKPTLSTVATSGSYNDLSNKPTIPTVNNATLTIQKNGTNVQTFTANQSTNATANITVPTKTSDLTNDSNFVESGDLAAVATSGSYNDLSNKPTIPTVNNATLTIQKNGTNVQTFTANQSTNATANITVPTAVSDLSDANDYATKLYVQSRGENLVTNGSGLLQNNYNFSSFTFDPLVANGTPGSFRTGALNTIVKNDELIPVDITQDYKFSFDIRTTNSSARFYDTIFSYDIDGNQIMYYNVNWISGTTTTLSQKLSPGDTVVHLTSLAGWNTTTTYSYQKGFIFWNYVNSLGYAWGTETYSRNMYRNLYTDNSAVNKTTNTITLSSAWAGPEIPAGTSVSQCTDGSNYIYVGTTNYTVTADTWVHRESILTKNLYRVGTAFVGVGWLANRDITGTISTWFNNVQFAMYTAPITVDSALSSTSTNPVQNRVINTALSSKADTADLATVATSGSYNDLSNKPTIPTVNNATLTVTQNGTSKGTFTANQSTNATIALTDTTYSAGTGINIDANNVISATAVANTFASYSNGTLYITNNATNADTENF